MTQIQDWAAALCVSGIGCTLLHMLCPAGTMRRVFGVLTAVFFFCCILSPVQGLVSFAADLFSVSPQTEVPTALSDTVYEQAQQVIENALLQDAQTRLADTVTVKKVSVIRDKTQTDSIYIERVMITLDREDRSAVKTVYTTLEQAWGITVEVYYSD